MSDPHPKTDALRNLLLYLQKVSVLGGRDRLDFRSRDEGVKHLWLPDLVTGRSSSVAELTSGGWTAFGLSKAGSSAGERECYQILSKMMAGASDVTQVAEVRFGVGILTKRKATQNVHYPLISCAAELMMNEQDGIEVRIDQGNWRTEGRVATSEMTGLSAAELATLMAQVAGIGGEDTLASELQQIVRILSACFRESNTEVVFDQSNEPPMRLDERGVVHFSPVLYLREGRDNAYGRFIGLAIDRLENDETLELSLLKRVVAGYSASSEQDAEISAAVNYLPRPTSREQHRIAKEIGEHELVLVQGPPGTGKSYAIASLLGPLLMSGKRVLVSAEREQALEAIYDQVPEPLKPLVFLTSTKSSTVQSGRAILRLLESFDRDKEERVKRLKFREIERLNLKREGLQARLEADPLKAVVDLNGGYTGELQALTNRLAEERDRFSWLKDDLTAEGSNPPQLVENFVAWQELVNELRAAAFKGATAVVPELEKLPDPEALRVYRNVRDRYDKLYHGRCSLPVPGVAAEQVKEKLARLREWHDSIPAHRWSVAAARSLGDAASAWYQLADDTAEYLKAIDLLEPEVMLRDYAVSVTIPRTDDFAPENDPLHLRSRPKNLLHTDLILLRTDLADLLSLFGAEEKVGKWKRVRFSKRWKQLSYLLSTVEINGKTGETRTHFAIAQRSINLLIWLARLDDRWGEYAVHEIDAAAKLRAYRTRSEILNSLIEAHNNLAVDVRTLEHWYSRPKGHFYGTEAVDNLAAAAAGLAEKEAVRLTHDKIIRGTEELRRYAGRSTVADEAIRCLETTDLPAYLNCFPKLQALARLKDKYAAQLVYERELKSHLPRTVAHFHAKPQALKSANEIEAAIRHRRAVAAMDRLCGAADSGPLRELRVLDDLRFRHIAQYVAAAVKLRFVDDLQSVGRFKAKLKLWLEFEQGKGKKTSAGQEASDAAFEYLLAYLPCLAMTVAEVTKRLYPEPGMFDVLIIDEASQLNVVALSMLFTAKRAVIIGDDKQISPGGAFKRNTDFEDIHHLVSALQQGAFFEKGRSFFDHVKLVADRDIQLREHFRCQPEIIAFSDAICYRGEDETTGLLPLRQAPRNRLDPLVTVYVAGATVDEEKNTNEKEAQRLVAYLRDMIDAPEYVDKTVGVITLLGDHQHRLINTLIGRSGLSPRATVDRKLKVGKPADFQGDERDVILLSLVTAPNKVSNIPWTDTFTQRFNVAMSRSRDQVVLFHSKRQEELPAGNLQQRLLAHCLNYKIARSLSKEDLPEQEDDRVLPPGFRSALQFYVAQYLFGHDYALLLDYQLGSLVIDLVVERSDGKRIALYCLDQTAYHDEEMRTRLVEQQLILQRVEWKVYEINGCLFEHNAEAVMERVVDFIEAVG